MLVSGLLISCTIPGSELPECGQLLGVDDLPLERAHLGSVLADRDDASHSSFSIENRR